MKEENLQNKSENMLTVTMERLKGVIDVDNVIGSPITTPDGTTIIPVSKVSVGFVSGGGEYSASETKGDKSYPFSGGGGSGYSINPVGFLSISAGEVKMLTVDGKNGFDRLMEFMPKIIEKIGDAINEKNK